jgi:hypothetical protein
MRFGVLSFVVALTILGFAACGGSDGGSPSAPTTPTVNSVSISGIDAVRTTFYSDYTATATLSDGSTSPVTPTWSVNNGNATITSAGRLSGVSHGSVTITATHQGRTGTKNVSIVSNYAGDWSGTYLVRKCDNSGIFATVGWCSGSIRVGAVLPFSLALNQAGNDRTQISGTIALGSLAGNTSGNVTGDGRLVIGGPYTVTSGGFTFVIEIGGWDSRLSGSSSMTGRWAQSLRATTSTGNAYQENDILTASHDTQQLTVVLSAPMSYQLTWSELMSILRQPGHAVVSPGPSQMLPEK